MRLLQFWLLGAMLLGSFPPCHGQDQNVGADGFSPQSAQIEASGSGPRTVSGTVVNSVTGEPIYRALVLLGSEQAVLTDHEGRFELASAYSGAIPTATKPGYFQDIQRGWGFTAAQSQRAGEPYSVTIRLIPEAIISGTVTDDTGQPIQGLPVQLKKYQVRNGLGRWQRDLRTTTNAEGEFRFAELQAGRYSLATGFHMEGLPGSTSGIAYAPAEYPSAGGSDAGSSITLTPGQHFDANIDPAVEKVFPVTGVIRGAEGMRGVGFDVETPGGEMIYPSSRYDPRTGEFRMMLPAGSFEVIANAYGQPTALHGRQTVSVQGPVNGVVVTLQTYTSLPVEIESEIATGSSNNSGQDSSSHPSPMLQLVDADPAHGGNTYMAQVPGNHWRDGRRDASAGPMAIQDLPPGHYVLQVFSGYPWYMASATCGNVDLLREELVISSSGGGCTIHTLFRNDPGSVSVTIRGNEPPANVFPYLLPIQNLTLQEHMSSQMTNNGGSTTWTVPGIPPGRYLALVLDHPEQIAYRDPEVLRRYASLGREVTVAPGGTAEIQLNVASQEQQ